MLKTQIDKDIKDSMLAGDKSRVSVLRNLKSAILYAEVEQGARSGDGLGDEAVLRVLTKESKKRQESADLYNQGGDNARAQAELEEKAIIDSYLPEQLSDEELSRVTDAALREVGGGPKSMGMVIAEVKKRTQGRAEGARIAAAVKKRIGEA